MGQEARQAGHYGKGSLQIDTGQGQALSLRRNLVSALEPLHTTLHSLIRIPIERSEYRRKARQEEQHTMMPQREASEPTYEQASSAYGGYEGNQADAHQQFETFYQQPLQEKQATKVYAPAHTNKNMLRLIAFTIAMVTLIVLAVLCLVIVGGTGGWISFCAAALAIFVMSAVVIDKIE